MSVDTAGTAIRGAGGRQTGPRTRLTVRSSGLATAGRLQQGQTHDRRRFGAQDTRPERHRTNRPAAAPAPHDRAVQTRLPGRSAARPARTTGVSLSALRPFQRHEQGRSAGQSAKLSCSCRAGRSAGTVSRSLCSAASMAMERSRSKFTRPALVRSVKTGSNADTPSSVAFCTTRSVVSRFSTANTSHTSASADCARTRVSAVKIALPRASDAMRQAHSPSLPLNSRTASPTVRRITPPR